MGMDEAGTHARLKAWFSELIAPKIARYGGRVVKLMGDGLLAEFPSVIDAVQWGIDVQVEVAALETEAADDQCIEYRVGINLGDGVNVAARLQEISETGDLCISEKVHTEVRRKVGVEFVNGGAQSVKNIANPVHV
jgi:adenylate cyclase